MLAESACKEIVNQIHHVNNTCIGAETIRPDNGKVHAPNYKGRACKCDGNFFPARYKHREQVTCKKS